jgi:hypothetical protein
MRASSSTASRCSQRTSGRSTASASPHSGSPAVADPLTATADSGTYAPWATSTRISASRPGCETFGQCPLGISIGSTPRRSRVIRRRRSGRPRCTSMGSQGRARSARHGRLAEGSTGVSTALTRASPRRSRGRETPARRVVLGRVLADPLGVQRRLGVASSSSAKLASGSGTRAASQIWCCGRERVRRRGAVDRPRSARGLPGRRERRPVSG